MIKTAIANTPINDEIAEKIGREAPIVRTVEELASTEGIRFETGRASDNPKADPITNGLKEFYKVPMIYNDQRGRAIVVAAMFAIYSANTSVVEEELILKYWSLFGFLPIRGRIQSMLEFMNTYGPDYEYIEDILNDAPGPENYVHRLRKVAMIRGLQAKTASFFLGMLGDKDSPTVDVHGIKKIMDARAKNNFDDDMVKFPEMDNWTTVDDFKELVSQVEAMTGEANILKKDKSPEAAQKYIQLKSELTDLKEDIKKRRVINKEVIVKTFSRFVFVPEKPHLAKGLLEYIKWQQYGFDGKTDNQWIAYDDMYSKVYTNEFKETSNQEDYTLHKPVYQEMFGDDIGLDYGPGSIKTNLDRMRSKMKEYSEEYNLKRQQGKNPDGRSKTDWDYNANESPLELNQYAAISDSAKRILEAKPAPRPIRKHKREYDVEDWSSEQVIEFPESVTTRYRMDDADPLSEYYEGNNNYEDDFPLESGTNPGKTTEDAYWDTVEDPQEDYSKDKQLRTLKAPPSTMEARAQAMPPPPTEENMGGNGGGHDGNNHGGGKPSMDNAVGYSDFEWQFSIPLNTDGRDVELYKSNKNNKWMFIKPDGEKSFCDTSLRRTLDKIREDYDTDMAGYIDSINSDMPRFSG